jgi:hypothetical protein
LGAISLVAANTLLNVSELMDEANKAIEEYCPEYFQSEGGVNLIYPADMFAKMRWLAFS